ncbi:DUF2218 domain-containing protein [Oricola thermophila]|uniref:DUF2218 domain-containing protein n=1 Tax=Oricola thermophila TaxID=2742145 RepID=A0A6N1VD69_9HYPH|nr:DUF2218 domain-containing protein [Oricola thermophila]QKV18658.1 DUF2218 domain-containing protein [Oricola thermophila]
MPKATARYRTENGRKYLVQLCKHFAHKIEVDYTEEKGRCELPPGPAEMFADDEGITFVVSAEDEERLDKVKDVITSHLARFAFREKLEKLDWTAA